MPQTQPFDDEVRHDLEDIFKAEIVDAVAPEMRIYYWLDQVYKIVRLNRFKRIARRPSTALPILEDSTRAASSQAELGKSKTRGPKSVVTYKL